MALGLSPEQFQAAFPFHLAFDAAGRLVQAGEVLLRICPALTVGAPLADAVTIARPRVPLDLDRIHEKAASLFILRLREPAVTLRGQMLVDTDQRIALFLGSPWLTRIDEATSLGLSLSDFANHDAVGEFLLLFQTKDMALSDAEALALRLGERGNALREANERLEAQERRLLETNDALSRSARLKDEFLSNMSHELRTPLNAILGISESLLEGVYGPIEERQAKALTTVETSGRHLLELINDILDLSRIEAGRMDLDAEPVHVASLCQGAIAMVRTDAARKSLALRLTTDANATTIEADQRRLKQILVNLLTNAVKFTPEGGSVTLTVTVDHTAGRMSMAVEDTGIGIAEKDLPRLFQPFEQLDGSLARHHNGTGLGLALTRRLVELHGGSIAVSSTHGAGSTFTVTLPWTPPGTRVGTDVEETARQAAGASAPDDAGRPAYKVLVIDDNESNQRVMTSFLEARHFDVASARSALAGLHIARLIRPDLILMDIQMPDVDGLEATAMVRRDPILAQTPIFAVTGLAMKGDRERCLAAGVDDYISKPVRLTDLVARIHATLDGARAKAH